MIRCNFLMLIFLLCLRMNAVSQDNPVLKFFPKGTVLHSNIAYNNDSLPKHLLDIYMPPHINEKLPLVVFVHGGAWWSNDKYADMSYMQKTIAEIVSNGFALASIDYRFSTQSKFPAQIQDCNRAVSFLYDNAVRFGIDKSRIAVIGFSAGGHLASLMGLSNNNSPNEFFLPGNGRSFRFKAVVDFYGPIDLLLFPGNDDPKSPESILIGATPLERPDLAKTASPLTYVDKNDPPFLIIHGEKDNLVSPKQSRLLSSWLNLSGIPNELIIVKDAPHFGNMFDADEIRQKVISFLKKYLQ